MGGDVKVWDASKSEELLSLHGHTSGVASVVFNHDSTRIASASYDKTIKMWSPTSGQAATKLVPVTRQTVTTLREPKSLTEFRKLVFSPGGKYVASGCCVPSVG